MITIRPEQSEDEEGLFRMYCQACGRIHEARLVDSLRENQGLFLSLVAIQEGQIVGGIAFSAVEMEPQAFELFLVGLAPLAVLPTHRGQGIGSTLVRLGLQRCRERQVDAVVVVGDPEFYGKFGFVAATPHRLTCSFPVPAPHWLVQELKAGALTDVRGRIKYRPEFQDLFSSHPESP